MRSYKFLSLASTALCAVAISSSAHAQNTQDEDVIVTTGLRQAYQGDFEYLEVPQADQSIDSEILDIAGIQNLNDALDLSASVSRQNNFGGLWNSFSIRGFSGDINLPSLFLVNGFNAGRGFGGPRDFVGIESVDVLKGPRAALYGRGEVGGTINLVTKRPQFETGGYVKGEIGSWDKYRYEGDVQSYVSGDGGDVGFRLVGFYEDAESFREGKETQKHGLYPSITMNIGDDSTLSYELEYTKQELPQDRGVFYSEEFGYSPRRLFTGEPDALIEAEAFGHQIEFQHNFSDNWSLLLGGGYRDTSLIGDAYENNFNSRQTFDNDGLTISRFFRSRDYEAEYASLRAEVTGEFETGSLRHRIIIGVDYDEFVNDQVAQRFRPGGIGDATSDEVDAETYLLLDVNNPVYGLYDRPDAVDQIDREEITGGVGFYIQDQIDLSDKFQIRIGGRFDDFDQELTNRRNDTTQESSNTYFTPQLGAVYSATDAVSVYATYGEGIRQLSGNDPDGDSFDPNKTKSAEIGVKADLGRLSNQIEGTLTATLFKVDQSNILVFGGEFTDPIAAGKAESQGVELDANVTFAKDIGLWASYAYTDATYSNGGTDTSTFTSFEEGDRIANSPEHQLSLQVTKDFEFGGRDLRLGGGLLYVGDRASGVGNDFELPSYTTARLFGEFELIENVAFRVDVDNLFDETYYTDSYENSWIQPGSPRNFRASAKYSF